MASAGSGSPGHLAGALFSVLTGAQLVHIPYKGGAPAVIDLLAGHVDVLFVSLPTALQHVRSGKLTAYGVSTKARASSLPDVPTLAQAGVKGYELVSWQGFLAPTGTPEAIIERLNTEIVQILRSTEVRDALVSQGYDIAASTPAVLDAELRQGTEKWLSLIRKSGATAN
jgi:tripartite-type tricarboxylate transporter receptor subunit TctC